MIVQRAKQNDSGKGRDLKALLPQHLADLRKSGLTDETILDGEFQSIPSHEATKNLLNWERPSGKLGPCLAIPFFNPDGTRTGYVRTKPDRPRRDKDGKPVKYESPLGVGNRAYYPPRTRTVLSNSARYLVITEGEKKAAKADQEGFSCIGLVGIYGWQKKRERMADGKPKGERKLTDDLASIPWKDRLVYICFDSDASSNVNVQLAESDLADTLTKLGARVKVIRLPGGKTAAEKIAPKVGLDDYLVAKGANGVAAFQALLRAAQPAKRPPRLSLVKFANYDESTVTAPEGEPKTKKNGLPITTLSARLFKITEGWPKRVGSTLFCRSNEEPVYLENPHALLAWIGGALSGSGENRPIFNPLRWAGGEDMVTQPQFFAYLQQTAEAFEAVEQFPHAPPLPRHYYLHSEPKGGDGKHLSWLLKRFSPATSLDADLILAFFLSVFCGIRPGQRPAWLITSDENDASAGRGVGKTKLVETAGRLVGGVVSYSNNDDMDDFKKRLLSPDARGKRIVLVDNIKSLKFSHADLEGMITCDVISGRRLYVGEGRRPNTLNWCLTINGASLSKDLAQRCVPLELTRPNYDANWERATGEFIEKHQWEIIGDILAKLHMPAPKLAQYSRWGAWEDAVLSRLPDPVAAQELIESRQADIDDDQSEADLVREAVSEELRVNGHNSERAVVLIPSRRMARIVNDATNEHRPTNKVSAYLKTLGITELRKSDRAAMRGWVWHGPEADPAASAQPIRDSYGSDDICP